MSEENKSVIKNTDIVAWGKKIAKMSRDEKKKAKKLTAKKKSGNTEEINLIKKDIKIDKSSLNLNHMEVMIGIGGLLVAVVALYLQYKNNNNKQISDNQIPINNNQIPVAQQYNYQDFSPYNF